MPEAGRIFEEHDISKSFDCLEQTVSRDMDVKDSDSEDSEEVKSLVQKPPVPSEDA